MELCGNQIKMAIDGLLLDQEYRPQQVLSLDSFLYQSAAISNSDSTALGIDTDLIYKEQNSY